MAAAPWRAGSGEQGILLCLWADIKLPVKCSDTLSLLVSRRSLRNATTSGSVFAFCPFRPLSDSSEELFLATLLRLCRTLRPGAQKPVVDLCKT